MHGSLSQASWLGTGYLHGCGWTSISLLYKKSSFSPLTGCVPVPVVNTSMFRPANSHSFRAMRYPPFIVQSETPAIAPILSSYIYIYIYIYIYMLSMKKCLKNSLLLKSHSIAPTQLTEVGRYAHVFNTTSQAQ